MSKGSKRRAPIAHPTREDRHRRKQGGGNWSMKVQRRYEIEECARRMDVAPSERIFEFFLIAWAAHNRGSKNPVADLMAAAKRMEPQCWPGFDCQITDATARAALDQAEDMPRYWKSDALADYLGVPNCVREKLGLKTIGSLDVQKKARQELRKREDKLYQERRRHERGAKPRAEAFSNTRPWKKLGMSRADWYRRGKPGLETNSSALTPTPTAETNSSAIPLSSFTQDEFVSAGTPQGAIRGGSDAKVGANTESLCEVTEVIHPDGSVTITLTPRLPAGFKPNFNHKPIPGLDAMTRWLEKKFPETFSDPRKASSRSLRRRRGG